MAKTKSLEFTVHLPNLLKEMMTNNGMGIFYVPIRVTTGLLTRIGQRASELNDPKLNALMCMLTIYEIADPESDGYDKKRVAEVMRLAEKA